MKAIARASALMSIALAQPGHAAEGVLEINQACATSISGCFPGDSGASTPGETDGFPVTIAQPGSYRLTSNLSLTSTSQTAIHATVGGVQIDLGGFTISGPNQCFGIPISSCTANTGGHAVLGAQDTAVRNGRIVGMGSNGVRLWYSARVEDLHVSWSGLDGISVGEQSTVEGCISASNGFSGISAGYRSVVRGNTSTGNAQDGFYVWSGVVQGNTATLNGGRGLYLTAGGFAHNDLGANSTSFAGAGHATAGNICSDGTCSSRGARRFFLTKESYSGSLADTACPAGFHFASFSEIQDVGALDYDVKQGHTQQDSGAGAPRGPNANGWARSGSEAGAGLGSENCYLWTSSSGADDGRTYGLDVCPGTSCTPAPGWRSALIPCDLFAKVWCVED